MKKRNIALLSGIILSIFVLIFSGVESGIASENDPVMPASEEGMTGASNETVPPPVPERSLTGGMDMREGANDPVKADSPQPLSPESPSDQQAPTTVPASIRPAAPAGQGHSSIERILSGQFPRDISRSLEQYGYDFFERDVKSFTAMDNVPVGDDYVIGPGDSFTIYLWGDNELVYKVSVNRDGGILVPQLGLLHVSGLTFKGLESFLSRRFKEYVPDFKIGLTVNRLRTIDVFMVGECRKPGTYTVSALSTVISALYAAGGPNKTGSLRNIKVMRGNEPVAGLDLYQFFIEGSKDGDIRLQSGDTIVVPVIGRTVGVAGNVKRPGIYEIKGEQTVGRVIDLAGGVLPSGYLQNVVVERVTDNERRVIKTFNLKSTGEGPDEPMNLSLKDFDVVKIYPVYKGFRHVVYLEGHVKYPREYELKQGMRLLDTLPAYDALLPGAHLDRAEVTRFDPPDLDPEILSFDLGALLTGDSSQNLLLQDLDRVKVYAKSIKAEPSRVTIKGAVRNPGTYPLYKGMTVRDLIFQADNLTQRAYLQEASLTRIIPGESGTSLSLMKFSPGRTIKGAPEDNIILKRDDRVDIREIPQYGEALNRTVTLEGEFLFPGEYPFLEGEALSSLIKRAGGHTRNAYTYGARFYRESVKEVQGERIREYISKLEQDVLTISALSVQTASDKEEASIIRETLFAKKQLLEKLKMSKPTGRMVINLDETVFMHSPGHDFELRPGDHLIVGKRPDTVHVLGEVYNPTSLFAENEKSVSYYLNRVGGINENADKDHIYVVRADGSIVSKSQEGFMGFASWQSGEKRWTLDGGFESIILYPGDTIIVPRKIEKFPWLRTVKDITQVMYQIAVTAGVLIVAF
ncbi:SLBB domain-containing protein [Thermodesulfobacteriota bacterium]